ncbi:MAG: phosphonate C-P lyase system protein PhnH [Sulfurospirillaceae bacterium]|nr:phosphonate C-P lyase system protein PhnH [Sulfurospirillaceae bacterium]
MQKIDLEKLNRKNFKALMSALSMPGNIKKISPLYKSAMLALSNVLLYNEVTYFFAGDDNISLVADITNPKIETAQNADYIFSDQIDKDLLEIAKKGTFLNPEFSATLIFACKDFNKTKAKISGPGIKEEKEIYLPCEREFIQTLTEKNSNYPLGIEVFFINEKNELMALSRTTKIEVVS